MFKLDKFFSKGLKDSVLLTGSMSHNGPWKQAYADTLIDRFHVSAFSSAEYTISVVFNDDILHPEVSKLSTAMARGLSWFRDANPRAYMILLD